MLINKAADDDRIYGAIYSVLLTALVNGGLNFPVLMSGDPPL